MTAFLYFAAGAVLIFSARRVSPISCRAGIALLLLPLSLTGGALLRGRVYGPVDLAYTAEPLASMAGPAGVSAVANPLASDAFSQFMPWSAAVRFALSHHQWPLWNPFELGGGPLAGAVQAAPYHPVHLVACLLPLPDSFGFNAAMFSLLAALSMFLFLRELAVAEVAALFGAAAWMLSVDLVSFAGTAHGAAMSTLPFALFGAQRIARRAGAGSMALLTLALSLTILAGHPESVLHVVALASFWFAWELFGDGISAEQRKRRMLRSVLCGFGAGALSLLLCAFFLLPMVETIPQTRELSHRRQQSIAQRVPIREAVHRMALGLVPYLDGEAGVERAVHPERDGHGQLGSAYVGTLALGMAAFVLLRFPDRRVRVLAGLAIFGILAGASAPGLTQLLGRVPVFSIAVNDRMISYAALALAAMAGIALDTAIRKSFRGTAPVLLAAALAFGLLAATRSGDLSASFLRISATRQVLPLLLAAVAVSLRRSPGLIACVLLALLLLQRTGEFGGTVGSVPRRAFYPPFAGSDLFPLTGAPYRITGIGNLLTPNIATHYQLEDVRGFQAMTFARLADTFDLWSVPQPVWSNRVDDLGSPFLTLMNVRFAITPPRLTLPAGWTMRRSYDGYGIAENLHPIPRAFVPPILHLRGRPGVERGIRETRDFSGEAWIEHEETRDLANGPGRVTSTREGTRLHLHASMASGGFVVVSEPAWKGWSAIEAGHHLKLRFADHAFLAFYLPQGEHDVLLAYEPRSFVAGSAISLATAIVLVLLAGARLRRRSPALS